MGKLLMIQIKDDEKIKTLQEDLKLQSKVEVVRLGLELVAKEVARQKKITRWKKAVKLAALESAEVNKDFQKHSKLQRL